MSVLLLTNCGGGDTSISSTTSSGRNLEPQPKVIMNSDGIILGKLIENGNQVRYNDETGVVFVEFDLYTDEIWEIEENGERFYPIDLPNTIWTYNGYHGLGLPGFDERVDGNFSMTLNTNSPRHRGGRFGEGQIQSELEGIGNLVGSVVFSMVSGHLVLSDLTLNLTDKRLLNREVSDFSVSGNLRGVNGRGVGIVYKSELGVASVDEELSDLFGTLIGHRIE